MTAVGIVIFVAGLLMTLYAGVIYVMDARVIDMASLELTEPGGHSLTWQPFTGIIAMLVGYVVLILAQRYSGRMSYLLPPPRETFLDEF